MQERERKKNPPLPNPSNLFCARIWFTCLSLNSTSSSLVQTELKPEGLLLSLLHAQVQLTLLTTGSSLAARAAGAQCVKAVKWRSRASCRSSSSLQNGLAGPGLPPQLLSGGERIMQPTIRQLPTEPYLCACIFLMWNTGTAFRVQ